LHSLKSLSASPPPKRYFLGSQSPSALLLFLAHFLLTQFLRGLFSPSLRLRISPFFVSKMAVLFDYVLTVVLERNSLEAFRHREPEMFLGGSSVSFSCFPSKSGGFFMQSCILKGELCSFLLCYLPWTIVLVQNLHMSQQAPLSQKVFFLLVLSSGLPSVKGGWAEFTGAFMLIFACFSKFPCF